MSRASTMKRMIDDLSGYVYYMQCVDTLRIKIGFSDDPEKRLAALNSGSPTRIELLATEPGDAAAERSRHREFGAAAVAHVRSREWFYPVLPLLELIRGLGGTPLDGPVTPGVVVRASDLDEQARFLHAKEDRLFQATLDLHRRMDKLEKDVELIGGTIGKMVQAIEPWRGPVSYRHRPGQFSSSLYHDLKMVDRRLDAILAKQREAQGTEAAETINQLWTRRIES